MQFPVKHSSTGTTIFTVMSGLAAQYQAINLSQGFPDYPLDPELSDLLGEAATKGFNQYAPMPGLPMLREAISNDWRKRNNVKIDADTEITVTPGATYGISTAFATILEAGDEAIVLEPAYDSYIPGIEMCGAKAVLVQLNYPSFSVDWNKVKDAITPKTKCIIFNTPHNPTGAVLSLQDLNTLADIIRDTNIVLISDEVYEQLIFDGLKHHSVLEHSELRQRSFAVFSFGKVFNNTGWKVGYTVAPPAFTAAYRAIHQYLCFTVNSPSQYALAKFMAHTGLEPIGRVMERKRNYFLDLLRQTKFTIHQPTSGSYFQTASYENISDLGDYEFAQWLTKEHGVATIPISSFYKSKKDDKVIRFCFAKKEETLNVAIKRLMEL